MPMNLLVLFAISIFFPKLQTIQQSSLLFKIHEETIEKYKNND